MSGTLQASIWDAEPSNDPKAPKVCPHCERELAHREDLRDNDHIKATGLATAYREHRQAHYPWGDDPSTHGRSWRGDPYLASTYNGDKSALWVGDDDTPSGDPDEVVGHVYDITLSYELQVRARVVAPSSSRAKEKVRYRELPEDVSVTEERTHLLHKEAREISDVARSDTELAERMEGWPW